MNTILIFFLFTLISLSVSKNDYILIDGSFSDEQKSHYIGKLKYNLDKFNPLDYNIEFNNITNFFPINDLKVQIDLECDSIIHLIIKDISEDRFENKFIPSQKYQETIKKCKNTKSLEDFGFTFTTKLKEIFTFHLKSNETNILTSTGGNFLFSDLFIALNYYLTSNDIYGFGERMHDFKLGEGKFTMWPNASIGVHPDYGIGGDNSYGAHPIALHKVNNQLFLGIIFNNINAQDVIIKTISNKNVSLEHRTIGGIIDYYFCIGNKPDDVLIQLHNILGNMPLPPYWTLGFHQCRYGYNYTEDLNKVVKNYMDLELPVDGFWIDIDTFDSFNIFSLNKTTFADLPKAIENIHYNNYHLIPIVDIAFPRNKSDPYYIKGHKENAFVISNYTKKEMVIIVWPGDCVLPDFHSESGINLWIYGLKEYKKIIDYDGIWFDMNEPELIIDTLKINRGEKLPDNNYDPKYNKYEYIPYIPGFRENERIDIRYGTISENAISTKYNDKENKTLISYNYKAQIPVMQVRITYDYLKKIKKRPFILTRSTSLGMSRYAYHWLGDNDSSYLKMKNGIVGIFNFQIFGIQITGDDICGFWGNSNDNLCARWMSLGAFFPFSRNHNSIGNIPQEPFAFGINSRTFKMSKIALKMRYSLIRFYYTELFKNSIGDSGSFFKPLFFEFTNDNNTYDNINSTVLIGNYLYLIPIFNDSENDINVYFPNEDWNYFPYGDSFMRYDEKKNKGEYKSLPGTYDRILIFLRGGSIIPYQDTFNYTIKNTFDLKNRPIELIIFPDSKNHLAKGSLIYDDDDIETLENNNYLRIELRFIYNVINFDIKNNMKISYNYNDIYLSKVFFWNMDYLTKKGNYDILRIELINKKIFNGNVHRISDDKYIINIEKYKIRFEQISSMILIQNNDTIFEYKKIIDL
jgi:alpha-glucosidase (family GH31 glycosyl hydrolase)